MDDRFGPEGVPPTRRRVERIEAPTVDRRSMFRFRDSIVTSLSEGLDPDSLRGLRKELTEMTVATGCHGVMLDFSAVDVMDLHELREIRATMSTLALLGVTTVWVGVSVGLVAGLVELGADLSGLEGALDLDAGLSRIDELRAEASDKEADGWIG